LFEDAPRKKSLPSMLRPRLRASRCLDVSPSIFRELGKSAAPRTRFAANLSPADEIAVVSFPPRPNLLLPFSTDRALLDRASSRTTWPGWKFVE